MTLECLLKDTCRCKQLIGTVCHQARGKIVYYNFSKRTVLEFGVSIVTIILF